MIYEVNTKVTDNDLEELLAVLLVSVRPEYVLPFGLNTIEDIPSAKKYLHVRCFGVEATCLINVTAGSEVSSFLFGDEISKSKISYVFKSHFGVCHSDNDFICQTIASVSSSNEIELLKYLESKLRLGACKRLFLIAPIKFRRWYESNGMTPRKQFTLTAKQSTVCEKFVLLSKDL